MEDKMIVNLIKEPEKMEETKKRYEELKKNKKVVVTSGYFDPLHHGHVELFRLSKQLGDYLIVVVNNDVQTLKKKGYVFMPTEDRAKIIIEFACVDEVFISIDEDELMMNGVRHIPVIKSLDFIKPNILAKGGDRYVYEIPETPVCEANGIEIIDGVGAKVQSSSELVRKSKEAQIIKNK